MIGKYLVHLVGFGGLALAVIPIGPAVVYGQDNDTREAVVKAWKDRQERTKSASFYWTKEQTDAKGCVSYYWKSHNPKLKALIPPKDSTFAVPGMASFDGNKLRYEYETKYWCPSKNDYEPGSYLNVFDGLVCALLHGPSLERDWHQGQIRKEDCNIEDANLHLQPILMTFRALMPGMRLYDIANFDLSTVNTIIDKRSCLELSQKSLGQVDNRFWVDPSRGFVMVRCVTLQKGVVQQKLDIRYMLGPEKEWVPEEWTVVFNLPTGTLERSYRARVTRYELNGSIPKEQFEMQFPPGTRVKDEKNNVEWIVKADGSGKRMISPSEAGQTNAQILSTELSSRSRAPHAASISWMILAGAVSAVVGLVAIVPKYRRLMVAGILKFRRTRITRSKT